MSDGLTEAMNGTYFDKKRSISTFREQLETLINKHSMENGSNTPDYILADYLFDCLVAFDRATTKRDSHRS